MLKRETVILFTSFPQMADWSLRLRTHVDFFNPSDFSKKSPSGFYSLDIIKAR